MTPSGAGGITMAMQPQQVEHLGEWIPARMDPGTIFFLENPNRLRGEKGAFIAVMSCPRCGTIGLITEKQLYGGEAMICGGTVCSAEYRLEAENIVFRDPQ
jgi:hypothetical protein